MNRRKEKQTHQYMMSLLNDAQKAVVTQVEVFGWNLVFVRQPLGQPAIPVLKDSSSGQYAIPESDGSLNRDHELFVRQENAADSLQYSSM